MENHIVCIYLLYMYDMYVSIIIYIFYYCSSVLLSKNMFDHFFLPALFGSVKVEFPHRSLTLFSRQYGWLCTTKYQGTVGQLTEMDDAMRNSKCQCIQNLLSTNSSGVAPQQMSKITRRPSASASASTSLR